MEADVSVDLNQQSTAQLCFSAELRWLSQIELIALKELVPIDSNAIFDLWDVRSQLRRKKVLSTRREIRSVESSAANRLYDGARWERSVMYGAFLNF